MANFQWRASEGQEPSSGGGFDTGDGCLFAVSAQQTTANPTLTLVPPVTKPTNTSDALIAPAPGDDLSPPNSVQAEKMNGIAVPVSASAGWSQSPPKQEGVYPSTVAYDLRLKTNQSKRGKGAINDSLELAVSLEYANPHYESGESMMVKVAVAKTLVNEELGTELALVATQFQEYLPETKQWVDITADVDYTKTADAVVDAVLQDPNAGQTAGKATITTKTVELTLGPFSAKARLNLTFQADRLYTYEAMSLRADAADIGSHRLLPLWVTLPFAPVHHEAGLSNLAVRIQAPTGTAVLPVDQYQEAYWDLKKQEDMNAATILAVSDLVQNDAESVGCQFQWESLPPRSTGLLAWLALPNPVEDNSSFDFVHIGRSLEELARDPADSSTRAQVSVQVPSKEDVANLRVPLPGHGPMGSLYRLKVKMPEAQPRQQPYLIVNLTLSDKSGSTGRRLANGTMRDRFNQLAEVRFLKRLESIPALVKAGILKMEDVWMEAFLAFDSSAPAGSIRRITFRVGEIHDAVVEVVQAIRSGNNFAANKLPAVLQHVQALRGVTPGGATDFSVGPRTLVHAFGQWRKEAHTLAGADVAPCAFVEFDTDGGHNSGTDYIGCLKSLCEVYDVRDGVVTGFGSWLNQDCASKVARVLGSVPALLAMQVPEPGTEGLDKVFRAGFSAWVGALRKPPKLTLKLSAGSVSFPAPVASRNANAVEVLGFRRIGDRNERRMPKFGAPDVSNEDFTKAVVTEVPSGAELLFYVVSRLGSPTDLARVLEVQSTSDGSSASATLKGKVWDEDETSAGSFLAFDWLSMLTSKSGNKGFQLAPLMATSLSSRLEDEVSFRFNIASPSGKTSYLGRCKTVANRASIDAAHQPKPPSCPIKILSPEHKSHQFGKPKGQWRGPTPVFRSSMVGGGGRGPRAHADGFHSSAFGASLAGKYRNASNGVSVTTYSAAPEATRSAGSSGAPPASSLFGAPPVAGFGAPAAAPGGGLFAGPVAGGFGPPAPSPGGFGAFGAAATSFAKPAWAQTNLKERKKAGITFPKGKAKVDAPTKRSDPSWKDALAVPVGSDVPLDKQDYDDLLNAMSQIVHARQRLQNDPSVIFVCDVCSRQLVPGEPRYHCWDCSDFDACGDCKDKHTLPFHHIAVINPSAMPAMPPEDPLVSGLLQGPPGTAVVAASTQTPEVDQTVEWSKARIRRFLLSVLHWWPVFRSTCAFREQLPTTLANELGERIVRSFNEDNLDGVLEAVTIVVDSLMREDAAVRSHPPSQNANGFSQA